MLKDLLRTSGLAALAAAMTVTALPGEAFARDNDRPSSSQRGDRGSARADRPSRPDNSARTPRSESRGSSAREARSEARAEPARQAPAAQPAPRPARQDTAARNYQSPRQVAVPPSRVETRAPRESSAGQVARDGWAARRAERIVEGAARERGSDGNNRNRSYTDSNRDRSYGSTGSSGGGNRQAGNSDRNGRGGDSNWAGRDGDRNGRDGGRDGNWRGRDGDRDGGRDGNWRGRDGDRDGNWRGRDGDRGDHRRWDRRWRDNDRYDWNHYRSRNRSTFQLGLYYAPYRSYNYSRVSIGFYLDSLLFGNRYWIDDPWSYRLPEVYGPYRWIRYYDDVLLVDIYTGEVVDVIYDFFW